MSAHPRVAVGRIAIVQLGSMLLFAACDAGYVEVAVVNATAEQILLKDPSFSGCVWNTVLAFGDTTTVGRCLPGSDRIHFQKLDVTAYCRQMAEEGTADPMCTGGAVDPVPQEGQAEAGAVPVWFNYQTVTPRRVDYGQFHLFEVTLDDMEQDFSVPGPYGH